MSGFFGTAGMLWWGAAASIPILIHLFARQRYKKVPWAAMEFLLRAYKKTRKRIRLEHLLLLILRILAILLFIFALADPRIESGGLLSGGADAPRDVIVILDDSFSMGAQAPSGGTPFSQVRDQAMRLTRNLKRERGDRLSYVTVSKPAQAIRINDENLEAVQNEIDRAEVGDGSTDFVGAFRIALAALEDLRPGAEVYLFTDAQKSGFVPPDRLDLAGKATTADHTDRPLQILHSLMTEIRARQASITMVVPTLEVQDNVAVQDIQSRGNVIATGVSSRFAVTVKNFGRRAQGGVVHFHVDGSSKPVEIETLDIIPPGQPQSVTFRHTFRVPGSHYVEARFLSDSLEVDNRRGLAVEVRDKVRTVIVDGDPTPEPADSESFYLRSALDPQADATRPSLFAIQVIQETRLEQVDLRDVDLLVLMNVGLISPRRANEIQEWVNQGGGLFVLLGDKSSADTLNTLLYKGGSGVLPAKILGEDGVRRGEGQAYELQVPDYAHPVLSYFDDDRIKPYLMFPPFYRYFRSEVSAEDPTVRVLAFFDRRRTAVAKPQPAIVEKVTGAGRTLLFTSTGDDNWNDLSAFPTYLMLMREMCHHLVRREAGLENIEVASPYRRILKSFAREVVVSRDGEEIEVLRPLALEDDLGYEVNLAVKDLTRAGVYRLDLGGLQEAQLKDPNPIFVAVNVDPTESDLTRLGDSELYGSFPGVDFTVTNEVETSPDGSRPGQSKNLWWWALMAALAMLVTETALSQWFGVRARGSA